MLSYGVKFLGNYVIFEGVKYAGKKFINHGLPVIINFLRKHKVY